MAGVDCGEVEFMPVERRSTLREEYMAGVDGVIESCRQRNGKTVYSRVISGHRPDAGCIDWGSVAAGLFNAYPDTFRFVFYTKATGAWLAATPELLLDFNLETGDFKTMALAGTRNAGGTGEWDEKNLRENRFVSEYIAGRLAALGIQVGSAPLETLAYGNIEHLCARIDGTDPLKRYVEILDAISPTPALCGWPKDDAIADIKRFERHSRWCYGGYVAVKSDRRVRAYVVLRCVHFNRNTYCLYGGGGITPMSEPTKELEETENKMRTLRQMINSASTGGLVAE